MFPTNHSPHLNRHEKHLHLSEAIDRMRERYGDRAVISAAGMEAKPLVVGIRLQGNRHHFWPIEGPHFQCEFILCVFGFLVPLKPPKQQMYVRQFLV